MPCADSAAADNDTAVNPFTDGASSMLCCAQKKEPRRLSASAAVLLQGLRWAGKSAATHACGPDPRRYRS
jgi:hypothetical protein